MPRRRSTGSPSYRPPSRPAPPMVSSPPPTAVAPQQAKQPGLMGQMAATAGGVAVGHVVGHAITGAFSGNGSNPDQTVATAPQQQPTQNPCQFQFDEFIRCANNQEDLTMCSAFRDVLKECQRTNGFI